MQVTTRHVAVGPPLMAAGVARARIPHDVVALGIPAAEDLGGADRAPRPLKKAAALIPPDRRQLAPGAAN
jgi:hypothetical protein